MAHWYRRCSACGHRGKMHVHGKPSGATKCPSCGKKQWRVQIVG